MTETGHDKMSPPQDYEKNDPTSQDVPTQPSRSFVRGPVDAEWSDLVLLIHSFTTGMVDAASYSNWAVFVGMQTGNTVILGLSTSTIPSNPYAWLTTLVSITCYLLGAFATFRLTNHLYPATSSSKLSIASSRLYLFAVFFVQALLILLAAALVVPDNLVPHNLPGPLTQASSEATVHNVRIVSLLPPLAFQSGMQIATSRLLGYNELPVNVLTSTYCDLMGDAKLLAVRNVKRNRRAASVVLLLAGAICSGWLMVSRAGLQGVFWIAGALKAAAAIGAFCLLKRATLVV